MIPRAHILAWQATAPWADIAQVEQDLALSRAIVELFSDPASGELLAFRGGTALHKLHLAPAARYSEDLDLVQMQAGSAKPVFELVQARLDPWLGTPNRKVKRNGIQLLYGFETELPPVRRMRLKVEVNTREHFAVLGYTSAPLLVDSDWFSGTASVRTYPIDQLLGTKLRALYQRKKGRDLFDLWEACRRLNISDDAVVHCFHEYLGGQNLAVSAAEFEANLAAKIVDPAFTADVAPLLRSDVEFDGVAALEVVRRRFLAKL